jgi:hypothetical protein
VLSRRITRRALALKFHPDILNAQQEIVLTFRIPDPVCPNKFGASDTRCMGFGLVRIGLVKGTE